MTSAIRGRLNFARSTLRFEILKATRLDDNVAVDQYGTPIADRMVGGLRPDQFYFDAFRKSRQGQAIALLSSRSSRHKKLRQED